MAVFTDFPFGSVLTLETQINADSTEATFSWNPASLGPYASTASSKTLPTAAMLKLSPRDAETGGSESIYVTNGTLNAAGDEITYTLSVRGVPDSENNYPPTESNPDLIKTHKARKIALFSPDVLIKMLEKNFSASSKVETILNNYGSFTAGKVASIRSSARPEQTNSSVIGIYTNSGVDGETATIQTSGIYSPATVSGGVIGQPVYADATGNLTATATNNVFIGIQLDTNKVLVFKRAEQDLEYDNSLIIDQNTMALMNDKNIKNIEPLITSYTATTDDTTNIKVLGSTGKRITASATPASNVDGYFNFGGENLEESDGGATIDTTGFVCFAVYVSDVTKLDKFEVYLTSGGIGDDYRFLSELASLSTGWNYLKLKKSSATTVGTVSWSSLDDIIIRVSATDTSQPYVVVDPATIQVIRKDPTTSTIPNPFQEEVSSGNFERVLNVTTNDAGLCSVLGNYNLVDLSESSTGCVIKTIKQWANSTIEVEYNKNVATNIAWCRIEANGRVGFEGGTTTFYAIDEDDNIDSSRPITACERALIRAEFKDTKTSGVLDSNEDSNVAVTAFSANPSVSQVFGFRIGKNRAIKSIKISNTSAVIERKENAFPTYEIPRVLHQETINVAGAGAKTITLPNTVPALTQADVINGRYQVTVLQKVSATQFSFAKAMGYGTQFYGGTGASGATINNWSAGAPVSTEVNWQAKELKIYFDAIHATFDYSVIIQKLW